jgi:toxin ParE1/3/4
VSARRPPRRRSGKSLTIVWTDRALADLEALGAYIAADSPRAAERWVGVLIETVERAASAPLAGRRIPEIGREDVREVLKRTYRIVYRVRESRLEVLTVFEGHRSLPTDIDD